MHVGEISFCDKVAYNIKSDETKKCILDYLDRKYGVKIVHKHFEKFCMERSINILNQNPHMICVRSNGNPYFLYLMKYNLAQYCIFIDKKIQQGYYLPRMIIVQLMFDECLFDDTIFEGEMIKNNNGSWSYVVNDMMVCKGSRLHDFNHPRRMNMIYDVLQTHFQPEEYDPFTISVKTYFKYNELDKLFNDHIPVLPYTCRGVYFKPLYLKFKDILLNFDDTLVKKVEKVKYTDTSKPFVLLNDILDATSSIRPSSPPLKVTQTELSSGKKTFGVRKTSTPDVYELYDGQGLQGIACVPSFSISKKMRELTKDLNMVDKIDLPFEFSSKFNKWILAIAE
jgi:hypothetical protein